METPKETRTAKFQSMVYNGKYGFKSSFPWLRLSGKWIEDAGFKIDETCQIKVSKNKLIITKIKTHETGNEIITRKKDTKKSCNTENSTLR